jgi:hypothetical protein
MVGITFVSIHDDMPSTKGTSLLPLLLQLYRAQDAKYVLAFHSDWPPSYGEADGA